MTVSTTSSVIQFNGDGNSTSFNFSYQALAGGDVTVILTNTTSNTLDGISPLLSKTLTLNSGYSLSLSNPGGIVDLSGGSSPFGAPSTGIRITLARNTSLTQQIDYIENDPFPAETHEEGLDRAAIRDQEIVETLSRLVRTRIDDQVSNLTLPLTEERKDKLLAFDDNGNAIAKSISDLDQSVPVTLTTVLDNDILVYDGINDEFKNEAGLTTGKNIGDVPQYEDDGNSNAVLDILPDTALSEGDVLYVDGSGNLQNLGAGTSGQYLQTQGGSAAPTWADVSAGSELLHIQDQKPSGTDGGDFISGGWRTRDLNTVLTNEIGGSPLSSNQITLPAGTYEIEVFAVANDVSTHMARFQNVTDNTTALWGISSFLNNDQGNAVVTGKVSIGSQKTFEIQHRSQNTNNTNGFGRAVGSNFTVDHETYTNIFIWKVS